MRAIALAWLACAALIAHDRSGGRLETAIPSQDEARTAIYLFGPEGAEQAVQAAAAASASCRRWLNKPGWSAELRRAGSAESLPIERGTPGKQLEQAFRDAAVQARDTAPEAFLTSLDAAAQALAARPGLRLLVVMAERPPLSTEAEKVLEQTIAFCRANLVRVIVVDFAGEPAKSAGSLFQALGPSTGGAVIREMKALDSQIVTISAVSKLSESPHASPEAAQPVAASLPPLPSDLPVHTRFFRLSARASQSAGKQRSGGAGPGSRSGGGGPNIEQMTGPMRGLFLVESPINALRFDTDDNAGTYAGRARMTQIARDASGKIVWQASKEVNLRGPLRKMETRRGGNLYYLRELVLPAGQYTLEALVEDLAAGKSGGVREPLRTGMGTPGFAVSDALVVRPFNGAADRFEADQVLNYDGNAIAPLLNPVYRAGEPFDLQIYLILYPALYGEHPALSLEVLRNGRVVGRSTLPFTDRIRNDMTEGGALAARGEQKHEFPYLATLRGARFGPGDYEARVTVRQGRYALTRAVNFRVVGDEQALTQGAGAETAPADGSGEELSEAALPEVDPVNLTAGFAAPETKRQLWEEAAAGALSYSGRLPNFRCKRETHRLTAPVRSPDRFREADSFIEELTYENGKESYRTLEINGEKSSMERTALKGVSSRGEFGSMLKSVFRPDIRAEYKWAGQAMTGSAMCDVFDIDVPLDRSNFVLTFNLRQEIAAFTGRVFVDSETNLVRRIMLRGSGLPKDFGLQSPVFSLEYGMVRIGESDYLVPLRSVLQVREGRQIVRNETRFRDYRKFEASSNIKFQ